MHRTGRLSRLLLSVSVFALLTASAGAQSTVQPANADAGAVEPLQPQSPAMPAGEAQPANAVTTNTSDKPADKPADDDKPKGPRHKGDIDFVLATAIGLPSLDPHVSDDPNTLGLLDNIYDALVRRDAHLKLQPALASKWVQIDPLRWRFRLRDHVRFHNGSWLDASDIQLSFLRIQRGRTALSRRIENIRDVIAVDPLTVDLVLKHPDPLLPESLDHIYIMDADTLVGHALGAPVTGRGFPQWQNEIAPLAREPAPVGKAEMAPPPPPPDPDLMKDGAYADPDDAAPNVAMTPALATIAQTGTGAATPTAATAAAPATATAPAAPATVTAPATATATTATANTATATAAPANPNQPPAPAAARDATTTIPPTTAIAMANNPATANAPGIVAGVVTPPTAPNPAVMADGTAAPVAPADMQEATAAYESMAKQDNPLSPNALKRFGAWIVPDFDPKFSAGVGTGPYVATARGNDGQLLLELNKASWRKIDGAFNQIVIRPIPDTNDRIKALRNGFVDLLPELPPEEYRRVNDLPNLKTTVSRDPRVLFLAMDQSRPRIDGYGPSGVTGAAADNGAAFPFERNPFKDLRVRQAIAMSIDYAGMRQTVMQGLSFEVGLPISPEIPGAADLKPPKYDPATARQKLADAGWPNGFRVILDCSEGRYINDSRLCQQISASLRNINIEVNPNPQPGPGFISRILPEGGAQGVSGFHLLGWRPPIMNSVSVLDSLLHTYYPESPHGAFNTGRISNPDLDRLIDRLLSQPGEDQDRLLESAWQLVHDQVLVIPLHQQALVWAMKPDVDAKPTAEGTISLETLRITGEPAE